MLNAGSSSEESRFPGERGSDCLPLAEVTLWRVKCFTGFKVLCAKSEVTLKPDLPVVDL